MKTINAWSQVPRFESEEDEAAFWLETRIDSRLMNQSLLRADNRESCVRAAGVVGVRHAALGK
jgi:hypothetical protein